MLPSETTDLPPHYRVPVMSWAGDGRRGGRGLGRRTGDGDTVEGTFAPGVNTDAGSAGDGESGVLGL